MSMPILRPAFLAATLVLAATAAPAGEVVTPETFIRAETDRMFSDIVGHAGGVNRFLYYHEPTPLDAQTVVRMNRDTLYMGAVIDTEGGASITMPEIPDGRYASILIVDNDHYVPVVFYEPGTHEIPADTRYMFAAVRIQVFNPDDPEEVALVNKLQDGFEIHAGSAEPMPPLNWDKASLDALRAQYEEDSAAYPSWAGMEGPRGKVNEETRHIAAAAAWGLFPEWDATYLNYNGNHPIDRCHTATYAIPENGAFWSITVYGSDGFIKSEDSTINGHNVELNPDGTFTAWFGSEALCGDHPSTGPDRRCWTAAMRSRRPGPSAEPLRGGGHASPGRFAPL
ncbi:DUF1254 domain-containing protein [Amaricoccus sp.]|uniref:DUF1254 domain-containing protein n=1 Tax=Amaricoccus sp. TaxID=1872485 RepID=UPI001B684FCF|nr:DUF1254 domain-containing protein [Amaricoccus sp.]MBP7240484.1 DUF1254 domain-containing protein [Amaricoccus sp.]